MKSSGVTENSTGVEFGCEALRRDGRVRLVLIAVVPDESVGGREPAGERALAGVAVAEAVRDAVTLDRHHVGGQAGKGGQRVGALVDLLQRKADVVTGLSGKEERLAVAEEADKAHRDGKGVHRKG